MSINERNVKAASKGSEGECFENSSNVLDAVYMAACPIIAYIV